MKTIIACILMSAASSCGSAQSLLQSTTGSTGAFRPGSGFNTDRSGGALQEFSKNINDHQVNTATCPPSDGCGQTVVVTTKPDAEAMIRYQRTLSVPSGGTTGWVVPNLWVVGDVEGRTNNYFWPLLSELKSRASGPGQHVAGYFQTTRQSGNSSLWAATVELKDRSNLPSSQTGGDVGLEVDNRADGFDDARRRVVIDGVITPSLNKDRTSEFTWGFRLQPGSETLKPYSVVRSAFSAATQVDTAFDSTQSISRLSVSSQPILGYHAALNTITILSGSNEIKFKDPISAADGSWIWIPDVGPNGGYLAPTIIRGGNTTDITLADHASRGFVLKTGVISWATASPPVVSLRMSSNQQIDLTGNGSRLIFYDSKGGLRYSRGEAGTPVKTFVEITDTGALTNYGAITAIGPLIAQSDGIVHGNLDVDGKLSAAGAEVRSPLRGTTGPIGGSFLKVGSCASGSVIIPGMDISMDVHATPTTYPGDGFIWQAYSGNSRVAEVKVCALVPGIPRTSTYNVRVIQ